MQIGQDPVSHVNVVAFERRAVRSFRPHPIHSAGSCAPAHERRLDKEHIRDRVPRMSLATIRTWALSALIGTGAVLAGCSTNSSELVHLPDGQSGFAINCSGAGSGSGWSECYQKAGDACGASGYDIVSKDNDDGAAGGGGLTSLATANVKSRSMVVRCK